MRKLESKRHHFFCLKNRIATGPAFENAPVLAIVNAYIIHCSICIWGITIHYSLLDLCMGNCHTLFIAKFVYGKLPYIFIAKFVYGKLPYIHYLLLNLCMGNCHTSKACNSVLHVNLLNNVVFNLALCSILALYDTNQH